MKFIEFNDCIVNTKYIGKIVPITGVNSYHGKYGITLILDGFENMTYKQLKEIRDEYGDDWYDWFNPNKYLTSSQREILNTPEGKAYMAWREAQEKSHYHDKDNEFYINAPFNRL